VRPQVAVYSAGAHNSYGHPHASTMENLERVGARIYGTDRDGTIVVSTDGATYAVTTSRAAAQEPSPVLTAPTSAPWATPAPPAASPSAPRGSNPCRQRVDASQAKNTPIVIADVDKVAEVVTIQNVGTAAVDLAGWTICSLLGAQLEGTLGPGETRAVASQSGRAIWNNRSKERGAVYNSAGQLISFWSEEGW
jgi:competence protein ComEC